MDVVVVVVGVVVVVVLVVVVVVVVVVGAASVEVYTFRLASLQGSTRSVLEILHSPVVLLKDTP